jgi:hypothetical protein
LRQLEQREQAFLGSFGPVVEDAALSPYQKDKLAASKARLELAHRLRMTLEDATMALSLDSPQSTQQPGTALKQPPGKGQG